MEYKKSKSVKSKSNKIELVAINASAGDDQKNANAILDIKEFFSDVFYDEKHVWCCICKICQCVHLFHELQVHISII